MTKRTTFLLFVLLVCLCLAYCMVAKPTIKKQRAHRPKTTSAEVPLLPWEEPYTPQWPPGVELTATGVEAIWNDLYAKGGCLVGGQSYAPGPPYEGCVLGRPAWLEFFGFDLKLTTPFLLQFADSKEPSEFHVCPFQNAYKGEFVFYVLGYIHHANWYEAPIDAEILKQAETLHEDNRQEFFRFVLENDAQREILKAFYRNKIAEPSP